MKSFGIYSDFLSVEEKLHSLLPNTATIKLPSIRPLIQQFVPTPYLSVQSPSIARRMSRKIGAEALLGVTLQMIDYCQNEFNKRNAYLTQNNIAYIFKMPLSTLASRLQDLRENNYITGSMTITEAGRAFLERLPKMATPPAITAETIRNLPRQTSSRNLLFGGADSLSLQEEGSNASKPQEVARSKKHKAT